MEEKIELEFETPWHKKRQAKFNHKEVVNPSSELVASKEVMDHLPSLRLPLSHLRPNNPEFIQVATKRLKSVANTTVRIPTSWVDPTAFACEYDPHSTSFHFGQPVRPSPRANWILPPPYCSHPLWWRWTSARKDSLPEAAVVVIEAMSWLTLRRGVWQREDRRKTTLRGSWHRQREGELYWEGRPGEEGTQNN